MISVSTRVQRAVAPAGGADWAFTEFNWPDNPGMTKVIDSKAVTASSKPDRLRNELITGDQGICELRFFKVKRTGITFLFDLSNRIPCETL